MGIQLFSAASHILFNRKIDRKENRAVLLVRRKQRENIREHESRAGGIRKRLALSAALILARIAAALTQVPAEFGIKGAEIFSSVAFVVILATMIYTTIMIKFIYKECPQGGGGKNNSSG